MIAKFERKRDSDTEGFSGQFNGWRRSQTAQSLKTFHSDYPLSMAILGQKLTSFGEVQNQVVYRHNVRRTGSGNGVYLHPIVIIVHE